MELGLKLKTDSGELILGGGVKWVRSNGARYF